MGKIRVAIVGVGNCANSLIQGVEFYRYAQKTNDEPIIGLVRPDIGPYRIADIDIVAAFDIMDSKVGRPLTEAIWAAPNDTYKFTEQLSPDSNPTVLSGPVLDGFGPHVAEWGNLTEAKPVDVAKVLKDNAVDVVINYLPVGSQKAAEHYAQSAIDAGCGFVNCIPVFLAKTEAWAKKFEDAGLPIIGDDIKSQVGATIVHRVLARLFHERGVMLDHTMQLNVGGNGDFLNMLNRERLESKKKSKTDAVVSIAGVKLPSKDVHIGPSDHVPWLADRKWAYIRLEGRGFGGAPLNIELKLEVHDSPNSAGIVIDAVRCAMLAKDRGVRGPVIEPSACFMKSPPEQLPDDDALDNLESWLG